jgi:hypothetical protein
LLRKIVRRLYERLPSVKATFDPDNVFRSTFNIAPA